MISPPSDKVASNTEQLEPASATSLSQLAHQLAATHHLVREPDRSYRLLRRLPDLKRWLHEAHQHFLEASDRELTLSYAAEWLLDNYYLVQQSLRQVNEDLPEGYYRQLPVLGPGAPLSHYPRIYALARDFFLYEQAQLDPARAERFINTYQDVQPLRMGELWAFPAILRLVALESLAQATGRLTGLLAYAPPDPGLQFEFDLRDTDVVARSIPVLRALATYDWREFFEGVSRVEQILGLDPTGIYPHMDFDTRDQYRKAVERLALRTGRDEADVAQAATHLAHERLRAEAPAGEDGQEPGREDTVPTWRGLYLPHVAHVGYFLVGDGRAELESDLGYRPAGRPWLCRWLLAHPTLLYLGSLSLATGLLLAGLLDHAWRAGGTPWQLLSVVVIAFIPVLTLATSLANWAITNALRPRVLPKLNFANGIPKRCRTIVVIPALLTRKREVESLLFQLELHHLRNPDGHLSYALLTDFADAPQEHMLGDDSLVAQATAGIEALNQRYPGRPFYLFHRRRLWNPSEGTWMGWERKRGKLHEFNRLLRGDTSTSFTTQVGDESILLRIRYVITLDVDTVLPRDSASRLVATLAHPLNQARFDPPSGRVVAGYTILQPRTEIKPVSANQSRFTRVFAGDAGLDLYSRAVSDIYQDLFGEGIYVGKGIYDVDAFERSLAGRVPENSLLSHDLFEGIHGRAGLVTDIILYEDYPPHYLVHIHRFHRWIRGDWQLLPWLLPRVPGAAGTTLPNRLRPIDRWKIVDNLQRSLLPPALLLLFLAGWTWLPGSSLVWTMVGLLAPAGSILTNLISRIKYLLEEKERASAPPPLQDSIIRWLLALAFLSYESLLALDAIVITLLRLLFGRHLLQWTTSAHTVRAFGSQVTANLTWQQMISALLIPVALALALALVNPAALPVATPLLILWALSPEIAYWISKPLARENDQVAEAGRQQLRSLARRTWFFFEQFVGPDGNWLPPDHFQEEPRGVVAHRTSPTNVGLYLLATLAAYDLGYVDVFGLLLRLQATFDTLGRLDRYRGHFLNWIDTRTLAPLYPGYISTVDSGNLAACLLALKQGCLAMGQSLAWRRERWEGLLDLLDILTTTVAGLGREAQIRPVQEHIAAMRRQLEQALEAAQNTITGWPELLVRFAGVEAPRLDQLLVALVEADDGDPVDSARLHELRLYVQQIHRHLDNMERHLELLLPWAIPLSRPPAFFSTSEAGPDVHQAWQALAEALSLSLALQDVDAACQAALAKLARLHSLLAGESEAVQAACAWCSGLAQKLEAAQLRSKTLLIGFERLAQEADAYVREMDFTFLYESMRNVFHIGYNLEASRLDNNYYDLLASEARLASLVAIAKYDISVKHWLHLARPIARLERWPVLLSWSGTMFEYFMPPLLIRNYEGTLLHQSLHTVVRQHVAYGRQKGVPWGISESGYYTFDSAQNYQYKAFGVPALGFKRGLGEELVISPYASLLALPLYPHSVLKNMEHLVQCEMLGLYGFYEALDYTHQRLALGQPYQVVRSYMSHHQGMILAALDNFLNQEALVRRFHAEPLIQSVELLLQERIPQRATHEQAGQEKVRAVRPTRTLNTMPWPVPLETAVPLVHHLSNGRYSVLISNAGGGYSQWRELRLTRWRADTTLDHWGQWLYVQDEESGRLWSAAYQPTGGPADVQVTFHPHLAQFRRHDDDITLEMRVVVAPDHDVEIRHVTVTNNSNRPRRLRLTSYGEVVLAAPGADQRHQAFVKLFVESQYIPEFNTLLFRRRPRSAVEKEAYLIHTLIVANRDSHASLHESDRARFLGRGRTADAPQALAPDTPSLSGTTGATLDPIFALGQVVELESHASATLDFITGAAGSRQTALQLAEHYQRRSAIDHAFFQARIQSENELRRLGLESLLLAQIQQLLSLLLYPAWMLRANPATLAANRRGQPGLWAYSISGDYPILLVSLHEEGELGLLQELILAHTYWRNRHLAIDLVILNEEDSNYGQALQGHIYRLLQRLHSAHWLNRRGGIFLLHQDQLGDADKILLHTAARVVLDGARGGLARQLQSLLEQPVRLPEFTPARPPADAEATPPLPRPTGLLFDNGWGGFTPDGREYVIFLESRPPKEPPVLPPAPWINVIANPNFGFLVSESGSGYTWAVNSGENRLTPWHNDPVADLPGEALYLRDEETAELWSPTPQPAPADGPYLVRHGAGYTTFEHHSHGLKQRLRLFAAPQEPVKIIQLRLENTWSNPRRLTITYYVPWVLGVQREESQQHIIPEYEEDCQALLARNPYQEEFGQRVAFLAANKEVHGLTADRTEFLGRLGSLRQPAALRRIGLAGRVEAGVDPAAVLQLHVDLQPGESEEVTFLLGQGADHEEALDLIGCYKDPATVQAAWQGVRETWESILGMVTVQTPDPAMDLLLNRWLLYQALSCRVWGRSSLYQSSGAYGFRDQLQDVMALFHTRPDVAREHILRAAHHQFEAGDVLHWWHPPSGRGVRTRISDDLVWLPFVTAAYVQATGDETILEEEIPFLRGEPLEEGQEERYGLFETTDEHYSLFEHCRRVLTRADTAGQHGLPLIGAGDWNDGMNRVGIEGEGESVWLGWFLYTTLVDFAGLCDQTGRPVQAEAYRRRATDLQQALEQHGWDGQWYRRAYYDDGAPLGSSQNRECQIDAIAQSWAVLSGAARPDRASQAMQAMLDRLVKWDAQLILLLTPPFDKTPRDPGYIKGYLPGIRENGGQYTHAALWSIWALARLGRGDLATALFRLINPIYRADTAAKARHYRVEPYVVAADVYGAAPHTGRGGWTWYTGSSGWMYRLGVEAILGLQRRGRSLRLDPHIPPEWPGYNLTYRYGRSTYQIQVDNENGAGQDVVEVILDGRVLENKEILLEDDGRTHEVRVVLRKKVIQ